MNNFPVQRAEWRGVEFLIALVVIVALIALAAAL